MHREASVIAIVGQTASGKTSAAIALAKQIGGEIICADSRTVYRHMDIGTAKPTKQEQLAVPHHLIDVVEPGEHFTVSNFVQRAKKCMQDIKLRGNVPIIVGGTGLYVDALLYNFQFPKVDSVYSRETLQQMDIENLTTLTESLGLDIAVLNTKNKRHLINAILRNGSNGTSEPLPGGTQILGITLDRNILEERIKQRVETMFETGFLQEAKDVASRFGWDNESMSGIGYRVAREYIEGRATEEEAKQAFIKGDRQLAKRQRTWFKRNADIRWFDSPGELIDYAVEFVGSMDYN